MEVQGARHADGDGDDVICVPDPDDPMAFHVGNAKGGDDVILGGDGIDWMAVLIEAGASASGVMLQAAYPATSTGVSLVD